MKSVPGVCWALWAASACLMSLPELLAPGVDCVFGPCSQAMSAPEAVGRALCYVAGLACFISAARRLKARRLELDQSLGPTAP